MSLMLCATDGWTYKGVTVDKPTSPDRPQAHPVGKKRAYQPPRLVEYGDVAKLTTSGSGGGLEGMSGKSGMN